MELTPMMKDVLSKKQAREMNPVVLAYVGDAVESLYTRTALSASSDAKAHALHVRASKIVNATAQARRAEKILSLLREEEHDIFSRARNSKINSSAKNAELSDYKIATGLEAVYGYLYLTGDTDRLREILSYIEI